MADIATRVFETKSSDCVMVCNMQLQCNYPMVVVDLKCLQQRLSHALGMAYMPSVLRNCLAHLCNCKLLTCSEIFFSLSLSEPL